MSVMIISLNFYMNRLINKVVQRHTKFCVDVIRNNVTKSFCANLSLYTNCFHDCTMCLCHTFVFCVNVCASCARSAQHYFHGCTYWFVTNLHKMSKCPKSQNRQNFRKIQKFSKKYQKSWKFMKNYEKVWKSV